MGCALRTSLTGQHSWLFCFTEVTDRSRAGFDANKRRDSEETHFRHVLALELPQLFQVENGDPINNGCCNELFAASLLQAVLRHAWLRLWNKHMTTGRINQVASCWLRQAVTPLQETSTILYTAKMNYTSAVQPSKHLHSSMNTPLTGKMASTSSHCADHPYRAI